MIAQCALKVWNCYFLSSLVIFTWPPNTKLDMVIKSVTMSSSGFRCTSASRSLALPECLRLKWYQMKCQCVFPESCRQQIKTPNYKHKASAWYFPSQHECHCERVRAWGSSLFKLRRKMLSNETWSANRSEQHDSTKRTTERKIHKAANVAFKTYEHFYSCDKKNDFCVKSRLEH